MALENLIIKENKGFFSKVKKVLNPRNWLLAGCLAYAALTPVNCSSDSNDSNPPVNPPSTPMLAFWAEQGGTWEIYTINADGTGQKRLTSHTDYEIYPDWSPDGKKIAFWSKRNGNWEIYIMNANGSGLKNLTENLSLDSHHAWSPDGTKIAFVSDRNGNKEVYIMNADGTGQTRLTYTSTENFCPQWKPK